MIFKHILKIFFLVLFDCILIRKVSLKEHVQHLVVVIYNLRDHFLFAKNKCSFGQAKVEYLGHVITGEGVSVDPVDIQAIVD